MSRRSSVAAALTVAVAAAAVVLAAAERPRPHAPFGRPQVRPVTSVRLSCPASPGAPLPPTALFAVGPDQSGPAPRAASLTVTGSAVRGLGGRPETSTAGVALHAALTAATSRLSAVAVARGSLAPGATAAQLTTYPGDATSGTAAGWCLAPRSQWWFSAVDTSIGTTTHLVLSNPSPAVALVDLQLLGADGPVRAAGGSGIAVAPRSRLVLDLARYAPGHPALTLHVTATRGTVTAAVSTTRLDALAPNGAEWVPASAPPARDVVVDAGVGGATHQTLVVTNPGPRQQLVTVRILDRRGAFTSTALADLQVPPGAVVVRALSHIADRRATAVQLSAAAPVTGAIVSGRGGPLRDFAVSTVSGALTDPAVVPVLAGSTLTLAFASADPGVADVRIVSVNADGRRVGAAVVPVRGTTTTTWNLARGSGAAYLMVTVPGGSNMHAVATYAGPDGITQLPVLSGRWTVVHPAVLP